MPLGDSYQAAGLDAVVASWPSSGARYALFDDVPVAAGGAGVELSGAGYTSPAFASSGWSAASGDAKTVTAAISFGTSTGAYASVGTHWAVVDSGGALVFWDDLSADQVVEVSASGSAVTISPTLSFADAA